MKSFDIDYRHEVTNEPGKQPAQLVRELDKRIVALNSSMSFKSDYELLCNVVHPSLGSFQLFSSVFTLIIDNMVIYLYRYFIKT